MSLNSYSSGKPNLVVLLPDLSNYTDWEHMIISYMRAKECYHAVNPDDELEKEMADLRMKAAGENKERQAEVRLRILKANSEALAIILQWIDQAHRPKIRRCTKANEAWQLLRPMRNAMTADILTGKFHDLKIEDFSKATDAMNELQSILNEIYATSEDAEKEFSQPAAVRMAVSKLPLEPYRQFKYDCFKNMPKTFTELTLALTELEQWSSTSTGNKGTSSSAFWVDKTNRSDKTKGRNKPADERDTRGRRRCPKTNITCWTCGKMGHFHYECGNTQNKDDKRITSANGFLAKKEFASSSDEEEVRVREVYWCNDKKKDSRRKHAHCAFSTSLEAIQDCQFRF